MSTTKFKGNLSSFRLISCFLFVALFSLAFIQTAFALVPARINHIQMGSITQGNSIEIEAVVENATSSIYESNVFFRQPDDAAFQQAELQFDDWEITGRIPADLIHGNLLEYYIYVKLNDGQEITFPTGAPEQSAPVAINIKSARRRGLTDEKGILIISPDPGSRLSSDEVLIAVSILTGITDVKAEDLRLELDGKNLTPKANVSEDMITIVVSNLRPGTHDIVLRNNRDKRRILTQWAFVIPGQNRKADWEVPVNGQVTLGYTYEDVRTNIRNITYLNGKVYGNLGKLGWATKGYVTSLESGNLQPQNRFLAGLEYGAFELRGGDTQPRFSEFSLWGVRTRGAELRMETGGMNLDVSWGYARRSIEGFGADDTLYVTDPQSGDTLKSQVNPVLDSIRVELEIANRGTFSREVKAIRPGINLGKNVVLSLNILKVKDDLNSIDYGLQPKDNFVFGYDLVAQSANRRFRLTSETALSMYNNDISIGAMEDMKDFESIIVINQNFQPLPNDDAILDEELSTSTRAQKVLEEITRSALAHRTTLTVNYFRNELRLGYKTIGKSFQSLGSPTVLKDVEGFSIEDRLRLLNNRVYFNIGYEDYSNNVNGRDTRTTDRNIIRGGISYYTAPQYPNLNLGVRYYDRKNDGLITVTYLIDGDSVVVDDRIESNTQAYSFGVDQQFEFAGMSHTAAVFFNSDLSNNQINSGLNSTLNTTSLNLSSKRGREWDTRISFSSTSQEALGGNTAIQYNTASANVRYMLLPKILWLSAGLNSTVTSGSVKNSVALPSEEYSDVIVREVNIETNRTQFSVGAEYIPHHQHSLNLKVYLYSQSDTGSIDYYSGRNAPNENTIAGENDFITRLRYNYTF